MKKFRLMATMFVVTVLCVGFASCSNDDEESSESDLSIIGKWQIERANERGENVEWDGYPYFVVTPTHCYFTDNKDVEKSDYSTYTYDASKKVMNCKYVNRDYEFIYEVLRLTNNEMDIRWDEGEEGTHMITIYCKQVN